MSFSGTQMLLTDASIPFILNLTASTVIGQHTKKTIISDENAEEFKTPDINFEISNLFILTFLSFVS